MDPDQIFGEHIYNISVIWRKKNSCLTRDVNCAKGFHQFVTEVLQLGFPVQEQMNYRYSML